MACCEKEHARQKDDCVCHFILLFCLTQAVQYHILPICQGAYMKNIDEALKDLMDSLFRRKRKMLYLRKKGMRDVDIAREFGVSKQRVLQILGAKNPRNG